MGCLWQLQLLHFIELIFKKWWIKQHTKHIVRKVKYIFLTYFSVLSDIFYSLFFPTNWPDFFIGKNQQIKKPWPNKQKNKGLYPPEVFQVKGNYIVKHSDSQAILCTLFLFDRIFPWLLELYIIVYIHVYLKWCCVFSVPFLQLSRQIHVSSRKEKGSAKWRIRYATFKIRSEMFCYFADLNSLYLSSFQYNRSSN